MLKVYNDDEIRLWGFDQLFWCTWFRRECSIISRFNLVSSKLGYRELGHQLLLVTNLYTLSTLVYVQRNENLDDPTLWVLWPESDCVFHFWCCPLFIAPYVALLDKRKTWETSEFLSLLIFFDILFTIFVIRKKTIIII